MNHQRPATVLLVLLIVLAGLLFWSACHPALALASSRGPTSPAGWIDPIVDALKESINRALRELIQVITVFLWGINRILMYVALLGDQFPALFGNLFVDVINQIVSSAGIIPWVRGAAGLGLMLAFLSIAVKPFLGMDLNNFRRVVLWIVIVALFFINPSNLYTELESFRTDMATALVSVTLPATTPCGSPAPDELIPLNVIACMAGATLDDLRDANPFTLPSRENPTLDECPPLESGATSSRKSVDGYMLVEYDPDDPDMILKWATNGLLRMAMGFPPSLLAFVGGLLQLALGLAAGMTFLLFPVSCIFAFFQITEFFPKRVAMFYFTIVLQSFFLFTVMGILISLYLIIFNTATNPLLSLVAMGLAEVMVIGAMLKSAFGAITGLFGVVSSSVQAVGPQLGAGNVGSLQGLRELTQLRMLSRMAGGMAGGRRSGGGRISSLVRGMATKKGATMIAAAVGGAAGGPVGAVMAAGGIAAGMGAFKATKKYRNWRRSRAARQAGANSVTAQARAIRGQGTGQPYPYDSAATDQARRYLMSDRSAAFPGRPPARMDEESIIRLARARGILQNNPRLKEAAGRYMDEARTVAEEGEKPVLSPQGDIHPDFMAALAQRLPDEAAQLRAAGIDGDLAGASLIQRTYLPDEERDLAIGEALSGPGMADVVRNAAERLGTAPEAVVTDAEQHSQDLATALTRANLSPHDSGSQRLVGQLWQTLSDDARQGRPVNPAALRMRHPQLMARLDRRAGDRQAADRVIAEMGRLRAAERAPVAVMPAPPGQSPQGEPQPRSTTPPGNAPGESQTGGAPGQAPQGGPRPRPATPPGRAPGGDQTGSTPGQAPQGGPRPRPTTPPGRAPSGGQTGGAPGQSPQGEPQPRSTTPPGHAPGSQTGGAPGQAPQGGPRPRPTTPPGNAPGESQPGGAPATRHGAQNRFCHRCGTAIQGKAVCPNCGYSNANTASGH